MRAAQAVPAVQINRKRRGRCRYVDKKGREIDKYLDRKIDRWMMGM